MTKSKRPLCADAFVERTTSQWTVRVYLAENGKRIEVRRGQPGPYTEQQALAVAYRITRRGKRLMREALSAKATP